MAKRKHSMDDWTTQSISKETAKLIDELADLLTSKQDRMNQVSKHEAVYIAVRDMVRRLKKRR